MKRKFAQWKKFAAKVADLQATILLSLVYIILITPLGIFIRLKFKQTLSGKRVKQKHNSYWLKKTGYQSNLKWAKQQ